MLPMDHSAIKSDKPILVDSSLSAPCGVVLSSDDKILYVSNADPTRPVVRSFITNPDGILHDVGTVFDANKWYQKQGIHKKRPILKGMQADVFGRLFLACQDGVFILPSGGGDPLALIRTGTPINNVALSGNGYVYMSADTAILRVSIGVPAESLTSSW